MSGSTPGRAAISGGTGSADPLTYSAQVMFQAVQPLPFSSCTSVPRTMIGSPMLAVLNSHSALGVAMLTQPCETLRTPWSPTDHGAAWMNSPPQVSLMA